MRFRNLEIVAVAVLLVGAAGVASAQLAGQAVPALDKVGIEEHLDAALPLELEFLDEGGRTVKLGDYFDGARPVILTLNYYRCPMLCGLQLNGVVAGMEELDWTPGVEFEMVTVSIDPLETPELAKAKKDNYLRRYQRPAAARGWHFLTGRQVNIERLAETVGFGYTYDVVSGQYAHAAAIFVITPDGRVARYLYGIEYPAKSLKLALMEASQGEIGSPLDQLIMYCYHYDPASRSYAPIAMNIMRVGGGATVLVLGVTLGTWWLRESRRRRRAAMESTQR
ncbi:MAG: SCO family protein [Holophagae bacterium]|nr:MAG: SCO family protein [Holophagae bacterium]